MSAVTPKQAAATLAIWLFGSMEIRLGDQPLPRLRSQKGEWLLALLTLRRNSGVSRHWLAGTLWPESEESLALYYLRRELSQLRSALGGEAWRLAAGDGHTLRLDLEGVFCDVASFDDAIARGDERSLEEAVALCRGPLLEGCTEPWVLIERESREQATLQALETLAERATERGDNSEAIRRLRGVIAGDPLRESAHRALMRALARDDDYAAAVLAYRDLRLTLHREMNVEPDAETTALFNRIREDARRPAKSAPPIQASVPGAKRRFPRPLTALVSRDEELREIEARLAHCRLLTLTGTGGVGKTRLAIQVAENQGPSGRDDYADGVAFVELAALRDPDAIAPAVASALEVREEPNRSALQTLTEFLASRRLLLILDNCEHLLVPCARLADALLSASPGLHILATSRQALGIPGETAWRVPSLSLPEARDFLPADKDSVSTLMDFGAIRLFLERAAQAHPPFQLTARNAPAIAQICRRLDGIPLALELAAARVNALPVEQIATRLDQRFRLLTGGNPAALPRQQTLHASIDWSYDLLSDRERVLLQSLTVFADGWTLEAAEAVIASLDVLDLLTSLVTKSLVIYEEQETARPSAGPPRYRLLESLREYAAERLPSAACQVLRQRHAEYFLGIARQALTGLEGAESVAWLGRLEADHGNFRLAFDWWIESGAPSHACLMARSHFHFWLRRGRLGEGREWLQRVIQCEGGLSEEELASAHKVAGTLARSQSDYAEARAHHDLSLALFRRLGHRRFVASLLNDVGNDEQRIGEYEAARSYLEDALAENRALGLKLCAAMNLGNLGVVAELACDYGAAASYHEAGLEIARELGAVHLFGAFLNGLGGVARRAGRLREAAERLNEAMDLHLESGNQTWEADCLERLGNLARDEQDTGKAGRLYVESLKLRHSMGDRSATAGLLEALAALAAGKGRAQEAARLFGAAEGLRSLLRSPRPPCDKADYERALSQTRALLDPQVFAEAWRQGQSLPIDAAVRLAVAGSW